jgi:ATP-dependent DNA helicase RecG
VSSRELAEMLKIRADSVRENILKLKKRGLIKRIGPAKGGFWEVV